MITIQNTVNASIDKVWDFWTTPEHITKWSFASPDWHTPHAENDLREGGKFSSTMAAKDGSMSFDFGGEYTLVEKNKAIEYILEDGRKVEISFTETPSGVEIIQSFDPETQNPEEMQRGGWQAILDNFKSYTEAN
ncbi:SRPBCC family protein [Flavobacterium hibernum]|uniref:Polyketide cyclase n=1 Tax=Flavobacterium hibernum TaxID=37752 RepID=A0A0D0F4I0_9FLAO|nr:SRPBCC family protein [Flavobacterium hibernum]KIO53027.1 polyketide cyclase [Flavobacterium hibernum]OXA91312.1 polyketide cyclase [Flavobacterium hibernum]STO15187.1 Activator of Hsp90 ATPase homolog 1-like protein [Flavobacterium hibernum]